MVKRPRFLENIAKTSQLRTVIRKEHIRKNGYPCSISPKMRLGIAALLFITYAKMHIQKQTVEKSDDDQSFPEYFQ